VVDKVRDAVPALGGGSDTAGGKGSTSSGGGYTGDLGGGGVG
jgi:hypothetical protein